MQANSKEKIRLHTKSTTFDMEITTRFYKDGTPISKHFLIGNTDNLCLSLNLQTIESKEIFGEKLIAIANLNNIEKYYECILHTITEDEFENTQFTKEMLLRVFDYIRENYPHVKTIKFNDKSYIPCDRKKNDTVDLLTYSIALYGKTWYENNFNAYLPKIQAKKYYEEIQKYMSKTTKKNMSWINFSKEIFMKASENAYNIFMKNEDKFRYIYDNSATFPDFFKTISKLIDREQKCSFFKYWMEQFIYSQIRIEREWFIDLHTQNGGSKNKSRKRGLSIKH